MIDQNPETIGEEFKTARDSLRERADNYNVARETAAARADDYSTLHDAATALQDDAPIALYQTACEVALEAHDKYQTARAVALEAHDKYQSAYKDTQGLVEHPGFGRWLDEIATPDERDHIRTAYADSWASWHPYQKTNG